VRSLWQNVRARAEGQKVPLRTALSQTSVAALDAAGLTLHVPDRTQAEILKTNMPTLLTAIAGAVGQRLAVRIVVDTGRGGELGRAGGPSAEAPAADEPKDLVRYAIDTLPR
jgi:hypothetical protein